MSADLRTDRLVRYLADGIPCFGLDRGEHFERLSAPPWQGGTPVGKRDPAQLPRLAPCEPSKIICIGLNYVEHVKESLTVAAGTQSPPEEPLFFFKPASAAAQQTGFPVCVLVIEPGG